MLLPCTSKDKAKGAGKCTNVCLIVKEMFADFLFANSYFHAYYCYDWMLRYT